MTQQSMFPLDELEEEARKRRWHKQRLENLISTWLRIISRCETADKLFWALNKCEKEYNFYKKAEEEEFRGSAVQSRVVAEVMERLIALGETEPQDNV